MDMLLIFAAVDRLDPFGGLAQAHCSTSPTPFRLDNLNSFGRSRVPVRCVNVTYFHVVVGMCYSPFPINMAFALAGRSVVWWLLRALGSFYFGLLASKPTFAIVKLSVSIHVSIQRKSAVDLLETYSPTSIVAQEFVDPSEQHEPASSSCSLASSTPALCISCCSATSPSPLPSFIPLK